MRKPVDRAEGGGPSVQLDDGGALLSAYPHVVEYCVESSWDDGAPRETSTLLLFVEEGRWKLCLHDRALSRSAWVSGASPEACLEALEAALGSEVVEWRRKRADLPRARR